MPDYSFVNSFNKEQKLASITLLKAIIQTCNQNSIDSRIQNLDSQIKFLGLSNLDVDRYIERINLNPIQLQNEFRTFKSDQIEFLISMIFESLICDGVPSEKDFLIAESSIVKIVGITKNHFSSSIEKIATMTTQFNKVYQNNQRQANTIEKTYSRMIHEANDPNQSSFSLNNIVFMVFMALAITGLISMCS